MSQPSTEALPLIDFNPVVQVLLDRLAGLVRAAPSGTEGTADPTLEMLLREVSELRRETRAGFAALCDAPVAQVVEEAKAPERDWHEALFGPELARLDFLRATREALLDGLCRGDRKAQAFLGQLLLVHASTPDRLPGLLREVGEAYYAWQPSADPLEPVLIAWLLRQAEAAGLRNRIERVDPGQPYNPAKHRSETTGAEIVAVHGWVILRENGSVYSKASVTLR